MKKISFTMKIITLLCVFSLSVCALYACKSKGREDVGGTMNTASRDYLEKILGDTTDADENLKTYLEFSSKMTALVTVAEVEENLPEYLVRPDSKFGFRIYDGTKLVPLNTPGVFDENKKTIFYAHGMGSNGSWNNNEGYYEDGYNLISLYWGVFADEDVYPPLADKVWAYDGNHRYQQADKTWTDDRNINYSIAEIYAAYYCELLNSHPDYDKEIIISGHSYGGMLTTAVLSYLTTAFRCGLLDSRLLPDKVLLCDPFIRKGGDNVHIRWLGNMQNPEYGGIAYLASQAVKAADSLGISVTLLRTSDIIAGPFMVSFPFENSVDEFNAFNESLLYIDGSANSILGLEEAHNFGRWWPAFRRGEYYDSENPSEYAYSLSNPYSASYARMHERYKMTYNKTPYDLTDDYITLQNPDKTKLYGFAFLDKNENGQFDERISSHIYGAKITISTDNGTIYEGTTSLNGYFEVRVDPGVYKIKAEFPGGFEGTTEYKVEVKEGAYFVEKNLPAVKK